MGVVKIVCFIGRGVGAAGPEIHAVDAERYGDRDARARKLLDDQLWRRVAGMSVERLLRDRNVESF